jgi:hypothetical protein
MARGVVNIGRLIVVALAAVTMLTACTPWPMQATGGLAERHALEWGAALQMDDRYQRLFHGGAVSWAPSRMMDARILLARARREHTGDLIDDAEASLRLADGILTTLEHDMAKRSQPQAKARPGT